MPSSKAIAGIFVADMVNSSIYLCCKALSNCPVNPPRDLVSKFVIKR